ncbi:MAG: exodeoxyribonuclease VII small subunit [Christensenellales bacterium]
MDKISFEDNLKILNQMSEKIRSGNLTLEESLKCYKDGMERYKECMKILEETKLEIETVIEGDEKDG